MLMSKKVLSLVLLSFAFLVLCPNDLAQKGYFRDTVIRGGDDLSFHIFSRGNGDKVPTRINRLLQLYELYALAKPPYSKNIFRQATANDGSIYGGKVAITSKVYSNNSRILSLGFYETSSGATTHYWNKYYNFNSGNGDRIELKDLFTDEGYKFFSKLAFKIRSAKYRGEVRKKIEPQYQESFMETVGCLESDNLQGYYIHQGAIVIDGDGCLIKAEKVEGLDMEVTIPSKFFSTYLNNYGKAVFGFVRADISKFRSKHLPQLFEGKIDGLHRFVMLLDPQWGDEYWGIYAYLKHGEGIALKGTIKDGYLVLTEYTLSPTAVDGPLGLIRRATEQGTISGKVTESSFEGTWSDRDHTKELPMRASTGRTTQ